MKVSPSILTCDFAHAADELHFVEKSGADMVHLDVMDGVFVPNLSFGPPVIASLRPHTALFFDVHLMICDPCRYLKDFLKAGADLITVHAESADNIPECLKEIRAAGCRAGLAISPDTPADTSLTAPYPFDQLYWQYLLAMVSHTCGDNVRYENTALLFNASYQSYGKWLKRRGA